MGCATPPSADPVSHTSALQLDTLGSLEEAVELYRSTRAERLFWATDPNERFGRIMGQGLLDILAESGQWSLLFTLADEVFEAELDRRVGYGQGQAPAEGYPLRVQRIHTGERGGFDASSCRACHFSGGPDGAGNATQVGLFRGDGESLSSATRRDSPHVMGLGWLQLYARQTERQLHALRDLVQQDAASLGAPASLALSVDGIDFGTITAQPDGTLDMEAVHGISPDLRIRFLGHKGRHGDLVSLVDEALQLHLGLQSSSRIARFAEDPEHWLGDGMDPFDLDNDGIQSEATAAQSVFLASYLSLLPVPQIHPPHDPQMAWAWAEGRRIFDAVGCAECHRPALYIRDTQLHVTSGGDDPVAVTLPMLEAALEPKPHRLDFGDGPDGAVGGVPIFPFTDLRRHAMGPELAEDHPESLPDGVGEVPGDVWVTRPLWGLADTAPYLHDGRAQTVPEAIAAHGGEAADSRDRWRALSEADRGALHLFLLSLTREPTILVE